MVVAEAQGSVHSEPVPPSEPPQSETGDGVHKDAHVPYYTQGQSGVLGNPQMVVMSPYHSMVRPTARYADDAHPLAMHMVRPTARCAGDAHAHGARYADDEWLWWSRAAARCAGAWNHAAARISTLHHAHDGTRCALSPTWCAGDAGQKALLWVWSTGEPIAHGLRCPTRGTLRCTSTVLRKLNPRCGRCAGGVPLSPNSLHKAQAAQWPAVVFSRGPDKKKRQREDFNTAQLKRLVEVYDMHETERPDRSRACPPSCRARTQTP